MDQRGDRSPTRFLSLLKHKWTERIVYYALVPALLLYSLWLPPASVSTRVFHMDYPLVTRAQGGTVTDTASQAYVQVPPQAVAKNLRLRLLSFSWAELAGRKADDPIRMAAQDLPADVIPQGPVYALEAKGALPNQGTITLPLPAEVKTPAQVDLYGWMGSRWEWLPAQVNAEAQLVRAELAPVPALLLLAQSPARGMRVAFSASALEANQAAQTLGSDMVLIQGLSLQGDGGLLGQLPAVTQWPAVKRENALLSISNLHEGVVRSDLVDNLIINDTLRQTHIQHIVAAVTAGPYLGVEIAYAGVSAELRPEFTAFIEALAAALHQADKKLAVRVDQPTWKGEAWDTGAYDWRALGRAADWVRVPALTEPSAYAEGGAMDRLLAYATGQVDRRKLDLAISAQSRAVTGGSCKTLSYAQALGLLTGNIVCDRPANLILPGQTVTLALPNLSADTLKLDEPSRSYWFTVADPSGAKCTVWLENAISVARKLEYVRQYALGGAVVDGALTAESDREIVQAVRAFRENQSVPEERFALVWTLADASGKTLQQQVAPIVDPKWTWTAPNNPGNYVIKAALSDDGGTSLAGAGAQVAFQVPTPTFTPTATPTNTPTPKPTATPQPAAAAGAEVVSSRAAAGYFGYGIQADLITDGNHDRIFQHITAMGFNWVKQQVEWFRYNPAPGQYDWGPLDRIVASANAYGVNLLFSVVKAPRWARPAGDTDEGPPADPNTYGAFMREMAARYKGRVKAYEIWNEQNLYYEWGGRGGKLSAARYMELLKVAYNAIKSVDPAAVVISGALTPTGVNDGDIAIDDRVYLEQMYQHGLARYCDAVGAHPSGYNNPPDADWRTWNDPSAPSFKGHPSFFFRGTMESYRNIMLKYGDGGKRIWPTEFGWATVENLGCGPAAGYGYAADNTEAEQAQFLVRAYQMGRAWGWVGPMFLWNLNFGPVSGAQDEKAAFGIVRPDWSPRPAFAALRDMPK